MYIIRNWTKKSLRVLLNRIHDSKLIFQYRPNAKIVTFVLSFRKVNKKNMIEKLTSIWFFTEVRAIPDVINGQLVGYNFIYGLQLENELQSLRNVDFARCFDDCNSLQARIWQQISTIVSARNPKTQNCKSFSYSKSVSQCYLYDHDRFDELERNLTVGHITDWLHYRKKFRKVAIIWPFLNSLWILRSKLNQNDLQINTYTTILDRSSLSEVRHQLQFITALEELSRMKSYWFGFWIWFILLTSLELFYSNHV